MKTCSKCGLLRELGDFYKNPKGLDGRRGDCKPCVLEARRVRYLQDGDVLRQRIRSYAAAHPRNMTTASTRGPEAVGHLREKNRQNHLKKYGLTPESFMDLLASQGDRCAICKESDPGKTWCVDHDHALGWTAVRGILCWHCNTALGHFRDDVGSLVAAADYLLSFDRAKVA